MKNSEAGHRVLGSMDVCSGRRMNDARAHHLADGLRVSPADSDTDVRFINLLESS